MPAAASISSSCAASPLLAACRAVEVLTERDQVGVIAFDDASKWVVELQSVTDVAAIQSAIGTIRAGGGTSFYSPLRDAYSPPNTHNPRPSVRT